MPAVWFAVKRSLRCKSEPTNVHDPEGNGSQNLRKIVTKRNRGNRSGCSRSIANLKDMVINGSRRHTEKPTVCSPRSIGSSELLNPITHEVVHNNSTCELKISNTGYVFQGQSGGGVADDVSDFVGIVKPGTPGPVRVHHGTGRKPGGFGIPVRRTSSSLSTRGSGFGAVVTRPRCSLGGDFQLFCHKCGEQFVKWEAVEEHHLSKHVVTELVQGDSSRKIVEIICGGSCNKPENSSRGIERILKVHNMQNAIAQFEEYRELVKIKANKLPKKHPRCMADGNELLRFHGSTLECSLGMKGAAALCSSDTCIVCQILRHGFSTKKESRSNSIGIFTCSTSSRAFQSIQIKEESVPSMKKALIVCRVIAGRVHRPLENVEEIAGLSGFDSLAGKVGLHSNIEELSLLSPRALLPCFVVIYKH
ncbi:uncharacterized protein LOC142542609 [Primulina tabacum]|uniref:uncharacterized protein LOC142542609 n=1 Tax=Primulina tabacum TaxID=48773 RepID=UPI003F5994E3